MSALVQFIRNAAWLTAALACFIVAVVLGALFAAACFIDGGPTPQVMVAHVAVMLVVLLLFVLALMGAGACASKVLE